jgi:glycosyltransferase involved in cell wall biosynthesis
MTDLKGKIFIVTVTFNDAGNLSKTLSSVRAYKKPYHQYIVIDGGSKDNTQALIKENEDIIDDWISERDSGIYDAMNKASLFKMDDNDLILWLNAGDLLTDWSGFSVDEYFKYDCVFTSVSAKYNDNYIGGTIDAKIKVPYDEKNFFPSSIFMHQGFMIKRNVFNNLPYDLTIGLQAENLLMSTCIINNKYGVFDDVIAVFYLDGVSNRDFKKLLRSYLKVAKGLKFNLSKVIIYQFPFILKTSIKIFLPNKVFNFLRKK